VRPLGIAIWSLGSHARRNLIPAAKAASSCRLVGLLSRDFSAAQSLAAEAGVQAFETPDQMLASEEVEAVVIAGPNGIHREHALEALSAGKHVFIEKSMGADLAEVELLVETARERDQLCAECFMYLHHPQFQQVRALVKEDGVVGRLRSIVARFGFPHLAPGDIRYRSQLAGGALLDAGAYCLSALRELLGDPRLEWCSLSSPEGHEVDTSGSAACRSGDTIGFADWGFGRSYRNELEIWGEQALVRVPFAFSKPPRLATEITIVHQADNREEKIPVPAANHFVLMLDKLSEASRSPEGRDEQHEAALLQARLIDSARRRAAGVAAASARA
jgi:predicted dehydrogenase